MIRTSIFMGLGVGAALALAACGGGGDAATPTPVVAVQAAPVQQGPIQQWITSPAVLYPAHQAVITPKISAPVARLLVSRGDRVHAGELVAVLENKDLAAANQQAQGQLEAAQAAYAADTTGAIPAQLKQAQLNVQATQKTLANAQAIYNSRQSLYAQGAIPKAELDQAGVDLTNARNANELAQQSLAALDNGGHSAALKAAQGTLESAQGTAAAAAAQLGYSEITSPINGVVTDRPVYPGELATTSSPLMTIMDLSQVVARAQLPVAQAAQLKVGDAATLQTPGSDSTLPGKVSVVSPATDPGSTTVEVWVTSDNPHAALKPGTSVQVAMLARTIAEALTVPPGAILTDDSGATTVMVVGADSKAHSTAVEVGARTADAVQITKGLQAGQRVITVGAYGLDDQTQVKVVPPPSKDSDQP